MGKSFLWRIMKFTLSTFALLVAALFSSKTEARIQCDDCVEEMHKLGNLVKFYGEDISQFLEDNYCPKLLDVVIDHFIVDGAVHMCQMMMACPAKEAAVLRSKELGCDECVEGLEFISRWMLDEFVVNDMVVYLEANFCLPDMQMCDKAVRNHFPGMHKMAMEEFFIPQKICQEQMIC